MSNLLAKRQGHLLMQSTIDNFAFSGIKMCTAKLISATDSVHRLFLAVHILYIGIFHVSIKINNLQKFLLTSQCTHSVPLNSKPYIQLKHSLKEACKTIKNTSKVMIEKFGPKEKTKLTGFLCLTCRHRVYSVFKLSNFCPSILLTKKFWPCEIFCTVSFR